MTFDCQGSGICTDLIVSNPDFSDAKNITHNDNGLSLEPKWSPKGRYIVYTHFTTGENGMAQLRLYDFKTDTNRVLTPKGIGKLLGLSFSPDERFLVYATADYADLERSDIFRVNLTTLEQINLTKPYLGKDEYPLWSPDGQQIAFTSNRSLKGNEAGTVEHIWVMKPDGSEQHLVMPGSAEQWQDFMGAWSPEGDRLAFYRGRIENSEERKGEELWVLYLDTGREDKVMAFSERFSIAEPPVWSPDGENIAVSIGNKDDTEVWLIAAYGSNAMLISRDVGINGQISWAPNSRALVYSYRQDLDSWFCLFIIDDDRIFTVEGPDSLEHASWSP